MNDVLPVSVVIPTVGRAELLADCLDSISRCRPRAAEVVVVDQSGEKAVHALVSRLTGARVLFSAVRDRGLAVNLGMREAGHEIVLVTDDDCTVSTSWIGTAWSHLSADPAAILTGRVLPAGDPAAIPSTIDAEVSRDYTGELHYGALYGGNMACNRSRFLAFGGFDERVRFAEDNDFCYRWLRAGRSLRYDPSFLIWHHAWRSPADLEHHLLAYARGQGLFYAKHLRRGDLRVARFLMRDLYRGARGVAARVVRGRSEWPDHRAGLLRGVLIGLVAGWRGNSGKSLLRKHNKR